MVKLAGCCECTAQSVRVSAIHCARLLEPTCPFSNDTLGAASSGWRSASIAASRIVACRSIGTWLCGSGLQIYERLSKIKLMPSALLLLCACLSKSRAAPGLCVSVIRCL